MKFIKKGYHIFFTLGVFLLPFNSSIPDWLGFLGEYSSDSSPVFFLISFCFLFVYSILKGKLYIPLKSTEYSLFLLFIVILLFATLSNMPDIIDNYFKQTTGIERFIRQFISLTISGLLFFITFVNVGRDLGVLVFFKLIRRTFLISFSIVFSCGILEYLIINHNVGFLASLIKIYDYLPFVEIKLDYRLLRVSSLTYEPPALGTYLITISGFMFSYIITSSKKATRFIPFIFVVILALISKSRTAFVVILLQCLVGLYFAYKTYPKFRVFFNKAMVVGFVLGLVFTFLFWTPISNAVSKRMDGLNIAKTEYSEKNNSVSNKSRLGIQVAMFETFKQNPILGAGWGQQAYVSRHYYPEWALKHNYEFISSFQNENVKSFPPGFNMYLRIMAEMGILGIIIFLVFQFAVIKGTNLTYKMSAHNKNISVSLFIGFIGFFFNWLQIDSFRIYGFWLCLAILVLFKKNLKENNI
jgi:O-antigen ligase